MANPNIVNVATIQGRTTATVVTTSTTAVITNSTNTNKIFKVNSLYISNTSSTTAYSITVDLFRNSVSYKLANTIAVPANASLIVIDKNSNVYLEEGDTIRAQGSAANFLNLVASFEEIS
jgi:hypothetical protein